MLCLWSSRWRTHLECLYLLSENFRAAHLHVMDHRSHNWIWRREGKKELKGWRKRRFIFNCMKLWKHLFIYAGTDVGRLAPGIRNWRAVRLFASFLPARASSCWCDISRHAECGCLVAAPTASACGSFLSCIRECVRHRTPAGFLYAGEVLSLLVRIISFRHTSFLG